MKKQNILIAIIFLLYHSTSLSQENLRFDGYYHTIGDTMDPFRYYLRFYEDGSVIYYCTAGNPATLLKWWSKNDQASLKGKYIVKDSTLNFSVKNKEGEVVYSGTLITGTRLWMKVKSLINK